MTAAAWLVMVVLLLCVAASDVAGQACSSYTTESACYGARTTCRWNPFIPACVDGPPTTCSQFFRDSTGCATNNSCAVNAFNAMCFRVPTDPPVSPSCNALTSVQACINAGCYYDIYSPSATSTAGKCYATFAEVKGLFPSCNTYSYYPSNVFADACSAARACTPIPASSLCQNPVGYSPNDVLLANRVTASYVATWTNPSITLDTLLFNMIMSVPTKQFLNVTAPLLHTVSFGPTGSLPRPLQPSKCNDLLQAQPAYGMGLPRISPAFSNSTALYAGLKASMPNLVYTSNDAVSAALYQATGYTRVGGTSVTASVYVDDNVVNKVIGGSADWLVANCNSTRTVVSTDETRYVHTPCLDVRSAVFEATTCFLLYNSIYTYGTAFFGASQRASLNVFVRAPADTSVGATVPFTAKRQIIVTLTYRTTNPNVVLGLRGLQDVSMVSTGGTTQTTPPTNCLGTRPVLVVPPSGMPQPCLDVTTSPTTYCWNTIVQLETRYNLPAADGLGLVKCVYQPDAVRIAEMGSNIPYPTSLDGVHNFYQFPYQWPLNNLTTGPFAAVGSDPTGAIGDQVAVSLTQTTPTDITYFGGTLPAPTCGILPFANSPITDLITPTYINNNGTFAIDLRNMALKTGSLLIFACVYSNGTRATFRLNFKTSLYLVPLDATGNLILNSGGSPLATLPWSQIAVTVPYTIRSAAGAHIDAVNAQLGVDAFGVTTGDLTSRMPANGYGVIIPFFGTLPALPLPTPGNRRLLQQQQESTDPVIQESTASFYVLLPSNVTQAAYSPASVQEAATTGLAVIGTIGGVVVGTLVLAGFAATASAVGATAAAAASTLGILGTTTTAATVASVGSSAATASSVSAIAGIVAGKPRGRGRAIESLSKSSSKRSESAHNTRSSTAVKIDVHSSRPSSATRKPSRSTYAHLDADDSDLQDL